MSELKELAKSVAADSIVADALARFIEQILREVHETRIAPLEREIARLKAQLKGK
jgi:uncharacterized small protein (DUF1192 family)